MALASHVFLVVWSLIDCFFVGAFLQLLEDHGVGKVRIVLPLALSPGISIFLSCFWTFFHQIKLLFVIRVELVFIEIFIFYILKSAYFALLPFILARIHTTIQI